MYWRDMQMRWKRFCDRLGSRRVQHLVEQLIVPQVIEMHGEEELFSDIRREGWLVWTFINCQTQVDRNVPILEARRLIHVDAAGGEEIAHYAAKIELEMNWAKYSGLVQGRFHTKHYFYDFVGNKACTTLLHLYEHPFPPTGRTGRVVFSV